MLHLWCEIRCSTSLCHATKIISEASGHTREHCGFLPVIEGQSVNHQTPVFLFGICAEHVTANQDLWIADEAR